MENIYYVYAYIRNKDSATAKAGTPYYIGKGSKNRAWTGHTNVSIPKNKKYILIIADNLLEDDSFKLEILSIKLFGRKDLGTGILLNKSDGGDQPPSAKGLKRSLETRKRMSEATKGQINVYKGKKLKPRTDEVKRKLSIALKGRPNLALKGRILPKFQCVYCGGDKSKSNMFKHQRICQFLFPPNYV